MNYENITEKRVLFFGDSNTFGYNPQTNGRYNKQERYTQRLQTLLGDTYTIIEEGLPGRTCAFDDPLNEGLNGLSIITPILLTHAPIDKLFIMLGTNDVKERLHADPQQITQGFAALIEKAMKTDAWRDAPDIVLVAPPALSPLYSTLMFAQEMGAGCYEKSVALCQTLAELARSKGIAFIQAQTIPNVEMHPLDGMHLTATAHAALAQYYAALLG